MFFLFYLGTNNTELELETSKVLKQKLELEDGVSVIESVSVASNLSSSCVYPACYPLYLFVTICSDHMIRFWKCSANKTEDDNFEYEWIPWTLIGQDEPSQLLITGEPLCISAAYCGRLAFAYRYGQSFSRPTSKDIGQKYINICVAIYECESTGGEEWSLEDTLHIKNIKLPNLKSDDDTRSFYEHEEEVDLKTGDNPDNLWHRKQIQLDWISKEDGTHILTVSVGQKVMLFTAVSNDLAQANVKAMQESYSVKKPVLRKSSSFAQPHFNDEIRWMRIRQIILNSADGLFAIPRRLSWVKDGILVVAMVTEMQVFSQWKSEKYLSSSEDLDSVLEDRCLKDEDLKNLEQQNFNIRQNTLPSMHELSKLSKINLKIMEGKKKSQVNLKALNVYQDYMPNYGLFEASRVACPVLPQYHPKQLMEFLNSGKVRWVKAILSHLVHYINFVGKDKNDDRSGLYSETEVSINTWLNCG